MFLGFKPQAESCSPFGTKSLYEIDANPSPEDEKDGLLTGKRPLKQEKRRNFEHSLLGPVYIIG
jgi:hypothetical protein